MVYIYIAECADGTLYTGWTTDLESRAAAHNRGQGGNYTRARGPVSIIYWETAENKSQAQSREAAIKKLSRQEKLALIAQTKKLPE